MRRSLRESLSHTLPLLLLLTLGLCVGLLLAGDYGASVDEAHNTRVGYEAVNAYRTPQGYLKYMSNGPVLAHHGPSYFMLYTLASRLMVKILPGWELADGRHFANWLSFLLAVGAFYLLSLRWIPRRHAWMATALFATQPMLFGHAFINQKDTPFLAFFLASLLVGWAAVDRLQAEPADASRSAGALRDSRVWRWAAAAYLLATPVLLIFLLHPVALSWAWLPGAGDLAVLSKEEIAGALWPVWLGRIPVLLTWVACGPLLVGRGFPRALGNQLPAPTGAWILLLVAAGVVGFSISIRPIGAFAGALVGLYAIVRLRRRSLAPLAFYGLFAFVVVLATWPYLWESPLQRLWISSTYTADFRDHLLLFRGVYFTSDQAPWQYVPTLIALQLTLPALGLALLGVPILILEALRRRVDRLTLLLAGLWFGLPLAAHYGLGLEVYNNLRQILFVLPVIFLAAGAGLHWAMDHIPSTAGRAALLGLVLLPGALAIANLHPYEYVYYNRLQGGVEGAAGEFSLDYWCTSGRAAMDYINEQAPEEAIVFLDGNTSTTAPYARSGVRVSSDWADLDQAEFAVGCGRDIGKDWSRFQLQRVSTIGRGKAIFIEIFRRIPPPASP